MMNIDIRALASAAMLVLLLLWCGVLLVRTRHLAEIADARDRRDRTLARTQGRAAVLTWRSDGKHAPHAYLRDDVVSLCGRVHNSVAPIDARRAEVERYGCSRCWRTTSVYRDHGLPLAGQEAAP